MTGFTLNATFAAVPRTARGQAIVLNGDPKGKNFLYCCNTNIYIRDIKDTKQCDVYTEHAKETTVAKYSPSGFYIASGDVAGKVRVWDTVNPEHILKIEHPALGGTIKDIDWTMDSQKLAVGGDGRENYARVFAFDTGNTVGDISQHSKSINSVSVKQSRPMRIVTGSEDFTSVFFEGPPFRFKCTKAEHCNFVNAVRFSPDGEKYVTAGSDGKLFVYDGKSSDYIGEVGEPKAHKGGIYAISFSPDSKKLLSVSGDKTARIWNMENYTLETEFVMGKDVVDMQVGCLWQGDSILTVSLSGYINYLDPANPAQPSKIVKGHNKPITALAVNQDGSLFFSASMDGRILRWDPNTSECEDLKGKGHSNQVSDLVLDGLYLISVGMDDVVMFTPADSLEYNGQSVKLDSQPRAVDSKNGVAVVACLSHLVVLQAPGNKLSTFPTNYEAISVSVRCDGTEVAVGTKTSLHVYALANGVLTESWTEKMEEVVSVGYSPDGASLAVASKNSLKQFNVSDRSEVIGQWGEQHTAKVTNLSWSPDSRRFISASLDTHLIAWEQGKFQGRKPSVKAHPMSHVNKLRWLNSNTLVTAGQDSNIRLWRISE